MMISGYHVEAGKRNKKLLVTSYVTLAAEEEGSSNHNICLGDYKLNSW